MKLQLLSVLVIVAGAYALPRANDVVIVAESSNEPIPRNWVEHQVVNVIRLINWLIRRGGLDPVWLDRREYEFTPVELDSVVKVSFENLRFNGASDIRIHNLDYNHLFKRLRLDISLPKISLSIGDSSFETQVEGSKFESQLKGSVKIESIRLRSEVYVGDGIEGRPISLRSVSVDFSVGGIESDIQLVVQGDDISEDANNYLGERIPSYIEDNRDDINGRIESFISRILNYLMSL